jgi:hypothetical protein
LGATGAIPSRFFMACFHGLFSWLVLVACFGGLEFFESETADIDRSRARPAAIFDHPLAAIAGRTAIVAVMAGNVVPVARPRRHRSSHAIADDGSWLA